MTKSSFIGYTIDFTSQAKKELQKIDKPDAKKIKQKLDSLTEGASNLDIKKLEATSEPTYRLRVGDYRIVFEVKHAKITILIINIAHRKEVYRRY
jgi:mRNA interferase RelE/StbE